jgi:imidazolonepropionase-like amidohydrolase
MAEALVRHQVTIDPTLIAMHTKFWGNDPRYTRHPQMGLVPEGVRRGWPKGSFTASWTDDQYRQAQAQWPKMQGLTKLLLDRGVLLTVGTDKPTPWIIPGVSFHEEMQLLADAGIPAKDVLRMATINGARALGKEKSIGAVEAGMRADLVVLRADPLVDIKNTREIETVIQGGKIYEPAKLLATTSAVSR